MTTRVIQPVLCSSRSVGVARHLIAPYQPQRRFSRAFHLQHRVRCATSETIEDSLLAALLDIRVGRVVKCERHPDAETLYVEQVDVGDTEPRTICSSSVPYVTAESLLAPPVVVLCNLKPRTLRGITSHGMLLCASDKANGRVAPLVAPPEAVVGERVVLGEDSTVEAASINRVRRRKIWESVQPTMQTDSEGVALCDGKEMRVAAGRITCASIPNAPIS